MSAPVTAGSTALSAAELAAVRADFPILGRTTRSGRPLVYLDSAATAQKPQCVIDAVQDFYEKRNAAEHRGAHQLAEEATEAYEAARAAVGRLGGVDTDVGVCMMNSTEGIKLVA